MPFNIAPYLLGLLSLLLCLPAAADENSGGLGQWSVSGYANLVASAKNSKPTAIELDDLSIFVSGKVNKWLNPFLEAEAYSMPLWQESQGLGFDRANLVVERLYNDIEFDDNTSLRFGKFLAPINHWNIVHAAPLVWTVNRPLTSSYISANYVTGLGLRHVWDLMSGHALELYWQPQDEFSSKATDSHPRYYDGVIGGRWTLHEDLDGYYGVSVQRANVKNSNETRTTINADIDWQFDYFELESELSFATLGGVSSGSRNREWGGYVQMVAPIAGKLYAVGRYEHFEFANKTRAMDSALAGVVYRPQPSYSFKLEWQQTFGEKSERPTGLFGSIAVLF